MKSAIEENTKSIELAYKLYKPAFYNLKSTARRGSNLKGKKLGTTTTPKPLPNTVFSDVLSSTSSTYPSYATVVLKNNRLRDVFAAYRGVSGNLTYSSKSGGDGAEYYTHGKNLAVTESTNEGTVSIRNRNGSFKFMACYGRISFGSVGNFKASAEWLLRLSSVIKKDAYDKK